jgi:hypothetical protein
VRVKFPRVTRLGTIRMASTNKLSAFDFEEFGTFRLKRDDTGYYWFGLTSNFGKDHQIELSIEVFDEVEPSVEQLQLIADFTKDIHSVEEMVFSYMQEVYHGTKWERSKEELKKMYYLIAVTLKRNNQEWWVVLESESDVPTIFNHFQRFTIREKQIMWSNIK